MPNRFDSSFTMFVFLRGHHLLEYYFAVANARMAANDAGAMRHNEDAAAPGEPWR